MLEYTLEAFDTFDVSDKIFVFADVKTTTEGK
jgi:hypothetical protein